MKGVVAKEPGGREQLIYKEQPEPEIEDADLLIEVRAAAVNRTDLLQREGKSGYLQTPILGVEVAGTVLDANDHPNFNKGDKVMGLVNGGAYAQQVAMPANRAIPIPANFSFEEAVAIPEVYLTAYQTMYWIGKLQKKESVLIHAGGSGVGTAAIQLARSLSDAHIITTAGSDEKLAVCKELGADEVINYKEKDFSEEVLKATGQKGVDLILDFIGASYWEENHRSIATDGRWVLIGLLGGSTIENVNLMTLMAKRIQLTGTLLTPRSDKYKAALTKDFTEKAMPHFRDGTLKPIIDTIYPITEVKKAHKRMERNQNIGKIILTVK